jgi:hypothetical protein
MKFGLIENKKRLPFFGFMWLVLIVGFFLGSNVIGNELKSTELICTNAEIKNIITDGYNKSGHNLFGQMFFNTESAISSKNKNIVKIWLYFMFNQIGAHEITTYASDRDLLYFNPLGYQKSLVEIDLNKNLIRKSSDSYYDCNGRIISKNVISEKWEPISVGSPNNYVLEVLKNSRNQMGK